MAHLIEASDNMFSARGLVPWHGLGTIIEGSPTIEEGIIAAGLNWNVSKRPIQTQDGILIPGQYATIRDDINLPLGVVGERFEVLQNADAFGVFSPLLDSGLVTLETAGSLRDSKTVWVLARVNSDLAKAEAVKWDRHEMYVLLSHGHDGTQAIRFGTTHIRVVCNNTMGAAHKDVNSQLIRMKHSKNAKDILGTLQKHLDLQLGGFQARMDVIRRLSAKEINRKDLEKYVRAVFDVEENEPSRVVDNVLPLFESGIGNDIRGVKDTAYAAVNAVTEFITHDRGHNQENRLNSLWFGQNAQVIAKAMKVAEQMFLLQAA